MQKSGDSRDKSTGVTNTLISDARSPAACMWDIQWAGRHRPSAEGVTRLAGNARSHT